MSGVLDEFGQWEHCNVCGRFELIQNLKYEKPSAEHKYGLDLCRRCFAARQKKDGRALA